MASWHFGETATVWTETAVNSASKSGCSITLCSFSGKTRLVAIYYVGLAVYFKVCMYKLVSEKVLRPKPDLRNYILAMAVTVQYIT